MSAMYEATIIIVWVIFVRMNLKRHRGTHISLKKLCTKDNPFKKYYVYLKAVDTFGNYSIFFYSTKPYMVTSNGERMVV